jgi:tRNA1Val (adenine37-N6)-methyltransferase
MSKGNYFEMKQMRIEQDQCAMKVSTDACIQGAWTPIVSSVKQVLDIGAGTGLLSLMLAQRAEQIHIDALELDSAAAKQAMQNIAQSKFANQIDVHQIDATLFQSNYAYDLIICNPPFFNNSLKGPDQQRNLARHTDSLTPQQLIQVIVTHLAVGAYAAILLPITEALQWEELAQLQGLYSFIRLMIQPFAHTPANRVVLLCATQKAPLIEESLIIYDEPKQYSQAFIDLMHPYYLYL